MGVVWGVGGPVVLANLFNAGIGLAPDLSLPVFELLH